MKQELPPRKKQLEWLKKKLKDEIPVLKGPVQIPSYINKMLSDLCGSKVITSEQVKLIEHILTSELKTNGDSVFRGRRALSKRLNGILKRIIDLTKHRGDHLLSNLMSMLDG